MNELSESRVMIQGFNQGGQRAIGSIRVRITIEDMQSSALLHVIDAKTSYNVLLGRPWIYENNVVPSTYHQCLKYYEGEFEKKIVADDESFTDVESHFIDVKFYLKNRIVEELTSDDIMKSKNDEPTTKKAEVTAGRAKVVTENVQPNSNKSYRGDIASYGKKVTHALQYVPKRKKDKGESSNLQTNMLKELTLPVKRIEAVKLSSNPLAGFVAQNRLDKVALPTKRTDEGFDPNAYRLFAKAGYNPNEPSKLGKLPLEAATRQPREGLGYKQQSPVRISIRRASINYITVEDEPATSNKPYVFDRLGKSTMRTFNVKPYIVVYTKECDEDEESVGSSYHITAQGEHGVSSIMEDNEKLEDVSLCYPPGLEEGVKATIDALKEVNLGTNEEPRPTYLSVLLAIDEESTYIELLKEFKDVFAWSYKEMSGLDPKVTVHRLAVKNGARPVKQAQRKKNGQIRVCVDFRDLNNACPEDEFPLPIPELMIDATTGYGEMSFMDGSSSYNQIRIVPKDEELTAFRTPKGIYCYKAIKGQALADFLVDHHIPDDWELTDELPDEDAVVIKVQPSWKMYFDGAAHRE
ncbi:uncharacterized protein [Nicotiana tomentosiformis]|uniref:uncharacterized protein n=1 Tax=Nicotiana tomentosiformis TaxID=4098 RepID=UPI00388CB3F5